MFLFVLIAFTAMYFTFAGITTLLTTRVFPALNIGAAVDTRPLRDGQLQREITRSLVSILIFAIYGLITYKLWQAGYLQIDIRAPWLRVSLEMVVLFLWNELHFYCCHRVLHTRWLYRHVHRIHHESVVPTPFSTYSFHWFEATLLGSVMMLPMLFHTFSLAALVSLPVLSILFNTIGHANYNVFAKKSSALYSASVEHSMHHRRVSGNYGFYLPMLDRWAGTALSKDSR